MVRMAIWMMVLGAALLSSGCAFHTTAKDWNGLKGIDGKPAYYEKTTKVAFNLLIAVPLIGNVGIDGMVRDLTADIAEVNGDNVRIVQGSSENYWYGFPPFTWVLTPVVTTVSAEYTPDREIYVRDQQGIHKEKKDSNGLNPLEW